jgi:maleylacetoacetate isomerase
MSPSITLYTNPVSDCAARVRLALSLKNLPHKSITVDLANQGNLDPGYVKINPSGTIPTLVIDSLDGETPSDGTSHVVLTQSLATLEYLEEAFPSCKRLLPPLESPLRRAHVRSLVDIIASDTHPLTAPRVSRLIQEKLCVPFGLGDKDNNAVPGMSVKEWDSHWIARGLSAYENTLNSYGTVGRFSVGDQVTLADVVLLPELWTAEDFSVDFECYPRIVGIYRELMQIEEVRRTRQKGKGFENF